MTIGEGLVWDDIEAMSGSFELIWELDNGHSIKSVTGLRDWEQSDWNDVDAVDLNIIDGGLTHDMTFFSEELQFLSPTGGDLEYILGLYYLNYTIEETTRLSGTVLGNTYLQDDWRTDVDLENIAVFGHATYKFSEQWTGFVGARLLREEQTVDGKRDGNFLFPGDQPYTVGTIDDTDWMGTIGLQYFPSDRSMFYGSYARGYKGGSIGNTIGSTLFLGDAVSPIIEPETVDSFEIGAKTSAMDNRVRMSATVYFSEFDDFQASSFVTLQNSFVFTNAGVLQTSGLELNVDANVWDGGTINFAFAYVDAKYDEFTGAPCTVPNTVAGTCNGVEPGTADLSGESVNNSPKTRYAISGQQDFEIGSSRAYFRAEYMWRDEVVFDGDLDPNTAIDSYGLLGARFGMHIGESVEVSLWGRNLTDEYYFLRIIDAPVEPGLYSGHPAPRRQVGADVVVRF
jgi:iron complex outermembrane receptor protein